MKNLLIASLVLIVAAQTSLAQGNRKVQFRTLCIDRVEAVDKVVIPGSGKKAVPQEVPLYTDISPVIDGDFGTAEAIFYSEKVGAGGKVERAPVGKVKLGKASRQLFVFTRNDDSKEGALYRVMAFDDDEKSFPMGHVRAINLASVAVRYVLSESEKVEVAAGGSAQFPPSSKVDEYNLYPVTVEYKNGEGEWVLGKAANWKSSDMKRDISVTDYTAAAKQLTTRLYGDLPPWRN